MVVAVSLLALNQRDAARSSRFAVCVRCSGLSFPFEFEVTCSGSASLSNGLDSSTDIVMLTSPSADDNHRCTIHDLADGWTMNKPFVVRF